MKTKAISSLNLEEAKGMRRDCKEGYVIVREYNYKRIKEEPVCYDEENGNPGLSGFIYIYPDKKSAQSDCNKLWSNKFKVKKVKLKFAKL